LKNRTVGPKTFFIPRISKEYTFCGTWIEFVKFGLKVVSITNNQKTQGDREKRGLHIRKEQGHKIE
jgi:hypothetical protein